MKQTSTEKHGNPGRKFPWTPFIVGLLAGTGGHWFALGTLHLLSHDLAKPWLALVALGMTLIMARLFDWLHHDNPFPRNLKEALPQFTVIWGIFVAALWFAITAEQVLHHWLLITANEPVAEMLLPLAGLLLLVSSVFLYERLAEGHGGIHDVWLDQRRPSEPAEAMILFLSTPSIIPDVGEAGASPHATIPYQDSDDIHHGVKVVLEGHSLGTDITSVSTGKPKDAPVFNWQQLMRVLLNQSSLKQLWIIGSVDANGYKAPKHLEGTEIKNWPAGTRLHGNSGKGSFDFAGLCRRFLIPYSQADIFVCERAASFDNYEQTMEVAREVLENIQQTIPAHKVAVDVTGGTKITSIVGATLTLNRGTRFQYVDTQPPHKVISFLLASDNIPGTHGHKM